MTNPTFNDHKQQMHGIQNRALHTWMYHGSVRGMDVDFEDKSTWPWWWKHL